MTDIWTEGYSQIDFYCPNCGQAIYEDEEYCNNCGWPWDENDIF